MFLKQFLVFVVFSGLCACCTVDKNENYIRKCTSLKQLTEAGNHPEWTNLTIVNTENLEQSVLPVDAFKNYPNLKELTINGIINKIELNAFRGLEKLETLVLENNDIEELPNIEYLKNLQQYFVKDSKITKIPENYFTKMPQLNFIMIANNKLTEIGNCALCGLSSTYIFLNNNTLKTFDPVRILGATSFINGLNLDENQLTTIQRFGKMPNLVGVNYVNNSISQIETNSFSQAPKFMLIDVSYNNVEKLEANIFPEMIRDDEPFFLIVHNTKIQCIDEEVRNKFKKLRRITLNDNPWSCECLNEIKKWAAQMRAYAGCDLPGGCNITCN